MPNARDAPAAALQAIDRAHLDAPDLRRRRTRRAKLLELFADQCRRILPGSPTPRAAPERRADLAHTLKGSAAGVGAERVARLADAAEDAPARRRRRARGARSTMPSPRPSRIAAAPRGDRDRTRV